MLRKITLAGVCAFALSATAMAQDAKTVIANAQAALGNVKSITYSGSARDVAFQQCGANATALVCHGTHDPMRPITNYVRVIDLAAPTSRHTGGTMNFGAGGSTTVTPGTFFQQVTPQQADVSQPWAQSFELYITPWGFLERCGRERRNREPQERRRQELHDAELEPEGEGAVGQELHRQRLRERRQHRRARRDVGRREHHGRHARRRHVLRLA